MPQSRGWMSRRACSNSSKLQLERAEELANSGNLPTSTLDDRRREYLAARGGLPGRDRLAEDGQP